MNLDGGCGPWLWSGLLTHLKTVDESFKSGGLGKVSLIVRRIRTVKMTGGSNFRRFRYLLSIKFRLNCDS